MVLVKFIGFVSNLIGIQMQASYKVEIRLSSVEDMEGDFCCVCLSMLEEGEETRLLPCLHRFHRVCVDKWLDDGCRKTCPVCRFLVQEENFCRREELTEEMIIWFSSFHIAGF